VIIGGLEKEFLINIENKEKLVEDYGEKNHLKFYLE
jgi:hypothetical protein